MARTPTRRTASAARRTAAAGPPGGGVPDVTTIARAVARPEVAGAALLALAAWSVPGLLPLPGAAGDAREAVTEALGLHVFTGALVCATGGALLALRRSGALTRHPRHLAGLALLAVFAAGVLGRLTPEADLGGVSLAQHTAGGAAGAALTGHWLAALAWLATLPAGFALLWPVTTRELAAATPGAVGWAAATAAHAAAVAAEGAREAVRRWSNYRAERREAREAAREAAARHAHEAGFAAPDDPDAYAPPPGFEQFRDLIGPPTPSLRRAGGAAGDGALVAEPEAPFVPGPGVPGPGVPAAADDFAPVAREPEGEPSPPVQWEMDLEHPASAQRHSPGGWQLPALDLLAAGTRAEQAAGVSPDNQTRARLIIETLASFGVEATIAEINEGPSVTQFGVEPGWDVRTRAVVERDADGAILRDRDGEPLRREVEVSRTRIRVNRITALQNDLALALAAPALRIEAPVPGKPIVGIEVPNQSVATVTLRDVMESAAFTRLRQKAALPIALGTGVSGEGVVADLARMPHLLIAGATGSGKSVCLNSIITCLLMDHSPDELRLVMVDPKRVELTAFAPIPHLAFSRIIVEMDEVVGTLQAVINEMDHRYRRYSKEGVRNIEAYNKKADETPGMKRMPYWVVVIDELADLMMAAPFQVENQLVRLAQLARATGIHLIVATQRPSVDVVTGLIKANFPTRIAFAVASQVDSRTVLDQVGAEKLLGRGDMLYVPTDAQKPRRVQGVYVDDAEIEHVVTYWLSDRFAEMQPEKHDDALREAQRAVEEMEESAAEEEATDPMLQKAIELARREQKVSTSMLQRKLRIGYPRAARVMDELEERGIVGPAEAGGSSRPVIFAAAEPATAGAGFSAFEDDTPFD